MGFKMGIVGMPNVGKSTLFNALTRTAAAQAANFPFCTIEPNVGEVAVPDARLDKLAAIAGSKQIIPTRMTFVDIAGLVRGASKGEGLGNQFLANIRECDAIAHVLRCFEDGDITHVEGRIDPIADAETIETELMLADMEIDRAAAGGSGAQDQGRRQGAAGSGPPAARRLGRTERRAGPPARVKVAEDDLRPWRLLQLLTAKPVLLCLQRRGGLCRHWQQPVGPGGGDGHGAGRGVGGDLGPDRGRDQPACRRRSRDVSGGDGPARGGSGPADPGGLCSLLGLQTYFTVGPKEARAWTITKGTLAPQAAGVIHGDFEKGFIRSETIAFDDYVAGNGEAGAKEAGKFRVEGKTYEVKDGDVLHFLFNA